MLNFYFLCLKFLQKDRELVLCHFIDGVNCIELHVLIRKRENITKRSRKKIYLCDVITLYTYKRMKGKIENKRKYL